MSLSEKLAEYHAAVGHTPEQIAAIKERARILLAELEAEGCYENCGCN